MIWKIILAPILGALIGYITNSLAIAMLFHPFEARYIGKWKIPLTPGLIPAQLNRIAASLGDAIGKELLGVDTLKAEALSEEAISRIRTGVSGWLETQTHEERSLRQIFSERISEARVGHYAGKLRGMSGDFLLEKIHGANLGNAIAAQTMRDIRGTFQRGLIGAFLDETILASVERSIAGTIDQKVNALSPELIETQLGKLENEFLDARLCDLTAPQSDQIPKLTNRIVGLYRDFVEHDLESLVHAIQIDKIVERKIAAFQPEEIERTVNGIVKHELNAIVYLGALLGFFMGFISLLF